MNIAWAGADRPELNSAFGKWCADRIGLTRGFTDFSSMAVFDDEKPIAVVVFHDWQPERGVIEFSAASTSKRWLNRRSLWEMFSYSFLQLGAQLVVMRVSIRNVMWNGRGIHRVLRAYGFKAYQVPRLRGRDEDEVIYTLSDDDWKANGFHKEFAHG